MVKPKITIAILLIGALAAFLPVVSHAARPAAEDIIGEIAAPPKTRVPPGTTIKSAGVGGGRGTSAPAGSDSYESSGLVRIKDIANIQGVRGNQLVGFGLVVGLEGTGNGQSSQFTPSSIANMLSKLGVNVPLNLISVKNVAAVMITAELPAFAKDGNRIDVTVSSMGDAKSLQGGTLIRTQLFGPDNVFYASAQGALSIGGFNFDAGGSKVQKNHVNVGRIPQGAFVEREVPTTLTDGTTIQITLRDPDFTTSNRMADAIRRQIPGVKALALDAATVAIGIPFNKTGDVINFIAQLEMVRVTPDVQAKIVVNERTGTVVMGGNVRLAPGSIAHGAINIKVVNNPIIVAAPANSVNAPPSLAVPNKDIEVTEKPAHFAAVGATTTVTQLVSALNSLGVTTRDLISILQAMHSAGMINAEIEVQ